jgi:uncharacterized protein
MTVQVEKRLDSAGAAGVESKREWRQDRGGELLKAPVRRADGTLICEAIVSKPGVLVYQDAKGNTWRELVPFETLADPDYLADCAHATVCLLHPKEDVTPKNVQELSVGLTDNAVEVLPTMRGIKCGMIIKAQRALDAIDNGIREVSPGYQVALKNEKGVHPQWGPYDKIQVKRYLNHFAIVPEGRSGPEVALRADGAYEVVTTETTPPKKVAMDPEEFKKMLTQLFPQLLEGALAPMRADMDAMKKDMAAFKGGGAGGAGTGENKKGGEGETQLPAQTEQQRMDELNKLAAERAELLPLAVTHKIDATKFPSTAALRRELALKLKPSARKDGVSDDYYRALIDEHIEAKKLDTSDDPYERWSGGGERHDDAELNPRNQTKVSRRDAMSQSMRGETK